MTEHVAIIGGGISGLAAAHRLTELAPHVKVTVLEARPRAGGWLGTVVEDGYVVELGPDSILTEKPWALALAKRLGLEREIVTTRSAHRGAYVVTHGALERIPDGFSLMAPAKLGPTLRSHILSWPGKARMLLEPAIPRGRMEDDESLASFVTRRLGSEVLERLAQPMIAGIYGADAEQLSLAATMPRFVDMEQRHGSVLWALHKRSRGDNAGDAASGARYGMFIAFRDGMQTLTSALERELGDSIRTGQAIVGLERDGGGFRVDSDNGASLRCDAVILATPAHVAARLSERLDTALSAELSAIPYGSAATVTYAWDRRDIRHPLDAFGFIVPSVEGRPLLACTWASVKWPDRAPEGKVLLRAFFGGPDQQDLIGQDDATLIRTGREQLAELLGIENAPQKTWVGRLPHSMPLYVLGHRLRVDRIEHLAAQHPGLYLAGNAYHGVGIPDAVHAGELAAEAAIRRERASGPSFHGERASVESLGTST